MKTLYEKGSCPEPESGPANAGDLERIGEAIIGALMGFGCPWLSFPCLVVASVGLCSAAGPHSWLPAPFWITLVALALWEMYVYAYLKKRSAGAANAFVIFGILSTLATVRWFYSFFLAMQGPS